MKKMKITEIVYSPAENEIVPRPVNDNGLTRNLNLSDMMIALHVYPTDAHIVIEMEDCDE